MTRCPIERLALFFADAPTRQGLLARAALGRPAPGDRDLGCRLAAQAAQDLRPDGSVNGAALPTIWRALELLDLGTPSGEEAARRALVWVLHLQGKPGVYGEGCERERHARRACEHYLVGFFAPAPPSVRLAPISLPNGKVYRAEPAARFALSCLALRAVLRGRAGDRTAVRRHVESLATLADQWSAWGDYFAPDLLVAVMHALTETGAERRQVVARLAALVAESQSADGGWSQADLFHVLDALRAAGTPEALAATRRAIPLLLARQRPDGSFGPMARQERALIALRSLLWASV